MSSANINADDIGKEDKKSDMNQTMIVKVWNVECSRIKYNT